MGTRPNSSGTTWKGEIRDSAKTREDGPRIIARGLYPDWETRPPDLAIILEKRFWGRAYSGERADVILSKDSGYADVDKSKPSMICLNTTSINAN